MSIFYKTVPIIHSILGTMVLILGFLVLISKKGSPYHKKIGSVYYIVSLITCVLAILIAYTRNNLFLNTVAIFTIYLLISGKRSINKTSLSETSSLDWALTSILIILGMGFFAYSIYNLLQGTRFGYIFLFFGMLSLWFANQDFQFFNGLSTVKNRGQKLHIQRMITSYILSLTAFIVVYVKFIPLEYTWFIPALILLPCIVYWNRKADISKETV